MLACSGNPWQTAAGLEEHTVTHRSYRSALRNAKLILDIRLFGLAYDDCDHVLNRRHAPLLPD
jgi:hypothetical protein